MQRQAVAQNPNTFSARVGNGRTHVAGCRMPEAFFGMKRYTSNFTPCLLHELWAKYLLCQANTHANEDPKHAMHAS